ncbi:arsenate reductase (azurin) small subunit [Sulfurisphaera javensis]|uniref:Arsenate reductase (Azurin) small subunit n=1 Tax=Sulfurisphaera javensis TaxID=2049879 RepID=A0AAT9GPJ8_9CREN
MAEGKDKKGNVDPNRRAVIIGGAAAVAGIAAGIVIGGYGFPRTTKVVQPQVTVEKEISTVTKTVTTTTVKQIGYVKQKVANISQLSSPGQYVTTNYMGYLVYIIKTGVPSENGVGPDNDIVGFSAYCAHMGYILEFDPATNCLLCPEHFSQYDVTRGGMQVVGHPNQYLTQLILEYDSSTGDIYALGFNRLVYGTYNTALQGMSSSSGGGSS